MDYQSQPKKNTFATAALVMGILSLVSLCTVIGPLVFGSLGIIFAILSREQGQKTATEALIGVVTSTIGCAISILLIVVSLIVSIRMLVNPASREQLNQMYEDVYGYSLDEMMEEMSGYNLDELLEEMDYE